MRSVCSPVPGIPPAPERSLTFSEQFPPAVPRSLLSPAAASDSCFGKMPFFPVRRPGLPWQCSAGGTASAALHSACSAAPAAGLSSCGFLLFPSADPPFPSSAAGHSSPVPQSLSFCREDCCYSGRNLPSWSLRGSKARPPGSPCGQTDDTACLPQ